MKTLPFTGSGVAIVTPFDGNKTDYDALGELIEWHIASGTDAIIVCGTTGEASTMPDSEHLAAIEYTVKKAAGRITVSSRHRLERYSPCRGAFEESGRARSRRIASSDTILQ